MKAKREMSNEVDKPAGVFGGRVGMVNADALKSAMAQSASADPRGSAPDGSDYMNFSGKRGVYEVGKDKEDVASDELWIVNVPSFEDGWICWKDGRPLATRLVPLGTPVPQVDMNEHGPFPKDGDGWHQAKAMVVRSIDTGRQAYFKINSISGVSTFATLQKEITQRLMAGQPYWPVISFGKEKFQSKGYTNYKPTITVDGWLSDMQVMNDLPAVFDSEDEDVTIDLEAMYAAASAPAALPHDGEGEVKTAKRNRRAV